MATKANLFDKVLSALIRWGVIVSILALLFVIGPWLYMGPGNFGAPRHPDMSFVSKISCVAFPPNAKLLNSKCDKGFQGGNLWAKVEVDRTDVDKFIESLPHSKKRSRDQRLPELSNESFQYVDRPGWWNPDSARHFVAVLITQYPKCGMVISLDDSKKAIVYLVWMG